MDTNNILNKSFMIGDWVMQAQFIDGNGNGHGWKYVQIDKLPFDEDKYIEPVPLTAEILEKNGFFCYSDNGKCWRYNFVDANGEPEDGIYINADFKTDEPFAAVSNRCYHAAPYCRYVHQLQHAILLCGLYKKIEL